MIDCFYFFNTLFFIWKKRMMARIFREYVFSVSINPCFILIIRTPYTMWYLPIFFNHNQPHCDISPRRQHVCVSAPTNVSDFNLTGQTITEIEVAVLNLPTIAPYLNLSLHSEWKDLLHSCAVRGVLRMWNSTSCCNCNPGGVTSLGLCQGVCCGKNG